MASKARSLSNAIRVAIGASFKDVMIWPQTNFPPMIFAGLLNGTKVYAPGTRDKALNGQSDLLGIIAPTGRMLCVEVKYSKDKASDDQQRWKGWIESRGGIWIEGREVEQVVAELKARLP